jgi:flagellar hook protein FlgE
MSIIGSMYTASTALDAFGESMAVVGHNIANINTAGFKASRIDFADVLPTALGEIETGHGVFIADAQRVFTQGAFESTSNVTDLAIGGNGFFILRDGAGASYYSRAGQFQLDSAYNLVNAEGYFLQGAAGNISLAAQQTQAAQATANIDASFNLDAAASTPVASFPATDASQSAWAGASNFSMLTSIYDSQGAAHDLNFFFRKTAPNTWEYRVAAARSELDPTASNSTDLRQLGSGGTLRFDSNGALNAPLSTITDISGMTWVNGATSQNIAAAGLRFAGSTQFAKASTLTNLVQDGWPPGTLKSIQIDTQGSVQGLYSNGNAQLIDAIQLAHFTNVASLEPLGDTLFLPTTESGAAQVGLPGSGGRGSIFSGALELSTVDLATEFVTMIASQRAFQINSQVITTADQMYSVAAELKA